MRRWRRSGLSLVALVIAALAAFLGRRAYDGVYLRPELLKPPLPQYRAARQVFPYSVVPGGVYEPKDVIDSMKVDPVAREHYKDVRVENLVPVRTQAPCQAHVSYRVGNKIFWTARTVTIPRGELLLTDGKNMIRARCGNRVAARVADSAVKNATYPESTLATIFEAPIPSLAKLPIFLQPVAPPARGMNDVLLEPKGDLSPTPEPPAVILCASGVLLILAQAAWRNRGRNGNGWGT